MSTNKVSPHTPKQSYAAVVQEVAPSTIALQAGICTRGMARKMTINEAAASLRAAHVPTKQRTFTFASIAAAANAIIASHSPPQKKEGISSITATSPAPVAPAAAATTPESNIASVMTIDAKSMEDQMLEMKKLLEQVLKDNDEKNQVIQDLQKQMRELKGKEKVGEPSLAIIAKANEVSKALPVETISNPDVACNEKQLQLMIANAVKCQLNGDASNGLRYTKPYTRRIDNLRMPQGYQPPKFQQFDGKGNPKQHIAHFVETCNNAGTEGDLLVKQFVRSLKGIAFDWYTDLDAETIDSWGQMEDEFLNRFYSIRRVVSMSELTSAKQREDEPVVEYINRWRALSLECKDRISETSAVEMCIDGMNWELLYILKGIKPRSFQELATRAHDMEITVKARGKSHTTSSRAFAEKKEFKKVEKPLKNTSKEAMIVNTSNAPVKVSSKPRLFQG